MDISKLSSDIWYLILQRLPSRNDLANVCKVSKFFEALAYPILYRSVIIRRAKGTSDWGYKFPTDNDFYSDRSCYKFPEDDGVESKLEAYGLKFGLFHRLLDERNHNLRMLVREVKVENIETQRERELTSSKLSPPNDILTELVKRLPNLKSLSLGFDLHEFPIAESLLDALINHKNSPALHLLGENGRTKVSTVRPLVRGVSINVYFYVVMPEKPFRVALNETFAAYPNLESLSVSIDKRLGGCVMDERSNTEIVPLSLNNFEKFPPLTELSLSGYDMGGEEQAVWNERFPWDSLQLLNLGDQPSRGVLKAATGRVQNLKCFTFTSYSGKDGKAELNNFLNSFTTLESLTLKECLPSISTVMLHENLIHLHLHEAEEIKYKRRTLTTEEIEVLDRQCPKLKTLKLDMDPHGSWPDDFIAAIASGFKNLRHLGLHVALGFEHLKDDYDVPKETWKSVLTAGTAEDFATRFFKDRGSSVLEMITLKTGEANRWSIQRPPHSYRVEKECATEFRIFPPQKEGEKARLQEKKFASLHEQLEREQVHELRRIRAKAKGKGPRIYGSDNTTGKNGIMARLVHRTKRMIPRSSK